MPVDAVVDADHLVVRAVALVAPTSVKVAVQVIVRLVAVETAVQAVLMLALEVVAETAVQTVVVAVESAQQPVLLVVVLGARVAVTLAVQVRAPVLLVSEQLLPDVIGAPLVVS